MRLEVVVLRIENILEDLAQMSLDWARYLMRTVWTNLYWATVWTIIIRCCLKWVSTCREKCNYVGDFKAEEDLYLWNVNMDIVVNTVEQNVSQNCDPSPSHA